MWEDPDFEDRMIEEPEVWGVQSISADGVLIRVAVKTAPQEQWAIGRELRQRIKARFDAEDIEVPYPAWVVRTGAGVQGMNPVPTQEPGDRTSGVSGKSVSVRVGLGCRRNITKKKKNYR